LFRWSHILSAPGELRLIFPPIFSQPRGGLHTNPLTSYEHPETYRTSDVVSLSGPDQSRSAPRAFQVPLFLILTRLLLSRNLVLWRGLYALAPHATYTVADFGTSSRIGPSPHALSLFPGRTLNFFCCAVCEKLSHPGVFGVCRRVGACLSFFFFRSSSFCYKVEGSKGHFRSPLPPPYRDLR